MLACFVHCFLYQIPNLYAEADQCCDGWHSGAQICTFLATWLSDKISLTKIRWGLLEAYFPRHRRKCFALSRRFEQEANPDIVGLTTTSAARRLRVAFDKPANSY